MDLGDLHKELEQQASEQLTQLRQRLNVTEDCTYLEVGITEKEIIRVSKEQQVDLIVLGSHGRRGLSLLLGSTAIKLLHGATCDVLTIHVGDED